MLNLILFGPGPGLLDKIIATAEGSPAAPVHAALLDQSGGVVYESVLPYVRMMPAESLPSGVTRVPLTLTDVQATALVAYLRARVGTQHYSVTQLGVDLADAVLRRRLPVACAGADCSGLIAEALVAVGALSTVPVDPGSVTPANLAAWVAAGMPHDLGALLTASAPDTTVTTVTVTTTPERAA